MTIEETRKGTIGGTEDGVELGSERELFESARQRVLHNAPQEPTLSDEWKAIENSIVRILQAIVDKHRNPAFRGFVTPSPALGLRGGSGEPGDLEQERNGSGEGEGVPIDEEGQGDGGEVETAVTDVPSDSE